MASSYPNLSSILSPLYELLHKQKSWVWKGEQAHAFKRAKELLTSESLLLHFDPEKDIIVSCDASQYGIGAVLSHRVDCVERPVCFTSRSLSVAEKGYSQLDREALAIIFAIKKFHQYLYGRMFTIHTDHKPLQHILGERQPVPPLASARLQRWALILRAYSYRIAYKSGDTIPHADGLSRLPLPNAPNEVPLPGETILLMESLKSSPVSAEEIKLLTSRDPILAQVHHMLLHGWREMEGEGFVPFQRRREELSVHDGCVLCGSRVVVPTKGRRRILELVHESHPGISRMKSLARGFVWWPGMDKDIEEYGKGCEVCQSSRHSEVKIPLQPWEWHQKTWARIHMDYAGLFLGKMFLLVVDANSKWIEVAIVIRYILYHY